MKTCGTCRHWSHDDVLGYDYDGVGSCTKIEHDTSQCTPPSFEEKAITVDGSGYTSAIICREDFGCVLHQEKE